MARRGRTIVTSRDDGSNSTGQRGSPRVALVIVGAAAAFAVWRGSRRAPVPEPGDPRSSATLAMIERLDEWRDDLDPRGKYGYGWNRLRTPMRREQLDDALGTKKEWTARRNLGKELLEGGDPTAALVEFEAAETAWRRDFASAGPAADPAAAARDPALIELLRWRAASWLRLGELENCIQHHGCESCTLPITAPAQHAEKRGSEQALALYLELL